MLVYECSVLRENTKKIVEQLFKCLIAQPIVSALSVACWIGQFVEHALCQLLQLLLRSLFLFLQEKTISVWSVLLAVDQEINENAIFSHVSLSLSISSSLSDKSYFSVCLTSIFSILVSVHSLVNTGVAAGDYLVCSAATRLLRFTEVCWYAIKWAICRRLEWATSDCTFDVSPFSLYNCR